MQLKAGDVVRLKSGGPKMTIDKIDDNGRCFCQWFESDKIADSRTYSGDALEIYKEESSALSAARETKRRRASSV